jgi:hypothetical protein
MSARSAAWAVAGLLVAGPAFAAPAAYSVAPTQAASAALLADDAAAWKPAQRVSWGPAAHTTEFAALWSTDALFLRFAAKDDAPWHTMTKRDEHLWEEEVVEIFIDAARTGRDYAEIEISPANVVCDVRMVQPSPDKKIDLDWNFEGLETRVVPWKDGAGKEVGWIALARLPFSGFRSLPAAKDVVLPPHAGDRWRFNLFRVDRPGGKAKPEQGAIEVAWSPTGEPSFHVPKAFQDLVFSGPAR